jgi:two-component system, LytTR family, response regulator
MRVLVVDDEAPSRRRLIRMLEQLGDVEVVGEAVDGAQAIERVRATAPDLVLLDIDMPGLDGVAAAERLAGTAIVFTTAHAEHAVRAFELRAVDYLLKPISLARLEEAIARVRERGPAPPEALAAALARLLGSREPPRVSARKGAVAHVFDARAIGRFFSADKYTAFVHEGEEYLLDESLSALESRLAAHGFVRVHRRELVSLDHVRALHGEGAGSHVQLADGTKVPVSRRNLPELRRRLGLA